MTSTCRRDGCTFPREEYVTTDGSIRQSAHCGMQCYVWTRRAIDADAEGDAREAAALLRYAALLDGRESAAETIPGLMRRPGKRNR